MYWLGLLILLFAVNLGWFPAAGAGERTCIVLPGLTLAAFTMALIARMMRPTTYIFSHGHMTTFLGVAIFLAVLAFNLLGDGLRDALDPRLRTLEGG